MKTRRINLSKTFLVTMSLSLFVFSWAAEPEGSGSMNEEVEGNYVIISVINVKSTHELNYMFDSCTAITGELGDLNDPNTIFIMPAEDATVTVNYKNEIIYGNGVTDIDGNFYQTVIIGEQEWMAENLKTTRYNDGTDIPNVVDSALWIKITTPAYCWYNNDQANYGDTYGALYNWYAVDSISTGGKNICPVGWHVPNNREWSIFRGYLIANGYNYDDTPIHLTTGNKIAKSIAAKTKWASSENEGAVGNRDYPAKRNITGFTALPGGGRGSSGSFSGVGREGGWWTTTETEPAVYGNWGQGMIYSGVSLGRWGSGKRGGLSVRCLRD